MTVFTFTDKAQKILGKAQGNLSFDAVMVFVCLAYLLYVAFVVFRKKKRVEGLKIIVAIAFLFSFSSLYGGGSHRQQYITNTYSELTRVYQNKEYKIAEGVVRVLHREPEGGHDSGDIINIDGIVFELSCFSDTFGYNKTIVYGGVLTEGTSARVFYYQTEDQSDRGKIILRIDLLEPVNIPVKKIDPILPCAG